MTDNEINITIAQACGVKPLDKDQGVRKVWIDTFGEDLGEWGFVEKYTKDLNAMHEAEKVLTEKQLVWYMQKLSQIRLRDGEHGMIACILDRIVFATARQRAEAFLRTIGKWTEEKRGGE